jgi:putative ATPase
MPGCRAPLAELVTYLAEAPKSTRAYEGYNRAETLAKRDPTLIIPIAMRDIPVDSMEAIGCGGAYKTHPSICACRLTCLLEGSILMVVIPGTR